MSGLFLSDTQRPVLPRPLYTSVCKARDLLKETVSN